MKNQDIMVTLNEESLLQHVETPPKFWRLFEKMSTFSIINSIVLVLAIKEFSSMVLIVPVIFKVHFSLLQDALSFGDLAADRPLHLRFLLVGSTELGLVLPLVLIGRSQLGQRFLERVSRFLQIAPQLSIFLLQLRQILNWGTSWKYI